MNNYLYSRNRNHSENIIQYISTTSDLKNTGVCLNNILILKGDYINDHTLNNHYYITSKTTESAVYTICISKNYWFSPESSIFDFDIKYGHVVYRNDYGFFSEFHYLEEICGDDIKNYIIRSGDVIAVVPELPLGMDVKDVEWEFRNVSRGTVITLQDIQEPFVGSPTGLETGYYDIIFRYRLDQNEYVFILDSAFVKK